MSTDRRRPFFAWYWSRIAAKYDEGGIQDFRRQLLAGLSGEVLEVGAGGGRNFSWYPREVTHVLAVEPEPRLRRNTEVAAASAPVAVTVTPGTAEHLPCADESMDAVICSLVLCSVDDQDRALREARRVLRPNGELRFLEHVRAETAGLRRVQQVLDATVWPPIGGGCHTGRDTAAAIERAGFTFTQLERFRFPARGIPLPTSPNIIGVAVPA
jgi:ubiquinone/menaquinone biosynthesis C-methylase UbiE